MASTIPPALCTICSLFWASLLLVKLWENSSKSSATQTKSSTVRNLCSFFELPRGRKQVSSYQKRRNCRSQTLDDICLKSFACHWRRTLLCQGTVTLFCHFFLWVSHLRTSNLDIAWSNKKTVMIKCHKVCYGTMAFHNSKMQSQVFWSDKFLFWNNFSVATCQKWYLFSKILR